MASSCLIPAWSRDVAGLSFNVTQLLQQKYEDSPKDDKERLEKCWGYNDCGDCHRSDGFCGWCALSQTCLPLPTDPLSRALPLLSPMRYKFICAMGPERFELRTAGLGCQVSTITFLTSIVTIFSTLFGVLVLYGLFKWLKVTGLALKGRKGGYMLHENGSGEIWVRRNQSWGKWWRRMRGTQKEFEVEEVDDDTARRGWFWWNNRKANRSRVEGTETTPLLGT